MIDHFAAVIGMLTVVTASPEARHPSDALLLDKNRLALHTLSQGTRLCSYARDKLPQHIPYR